MMARWQFWIDRGGTFTDVVAQSPDGRILTHKLLSHHPERYRDAALAGIRHFLGVSETDPIPTERIDVVKMGTTVATNALLERQGEPTVLAITRGFGDALRIAYQNRPRLFDRHIVLPELLYTRVIEVDERIAKDGTVLQPLDVPAAERALREAHDAGLRAIAIVCMHGYRYPAHERTLAQLAQSVGFEQVSVSHEVSPLMKLVPRGDTTVVDAYLSPILQTYVEQVSRELTGVRLMFMQSNGGLADATRFRGKDAVLSGPAGGIVGMSKTSARVGEERIIGFDMGGTSTDVSHYRGEFERTLFAHVAGIRMRAPMLSIHTVAAGGGSILSFDGARQRVGPQSAGAVPGPACYRRGGPLTVTDANVMLGRIQPDHFPRVFGPSFDLPLDRDIVREKFAALAAEIGRGTPEEVAEGFLRIAISNMANAIKKISVQRGYDIKDYALTTFGGAGGQHACRVADELGMTKILFPPFAGVLSAYGMGLADSVAMRERAVESELSESLLADLLPAANELAIEARHELARDGISEGAITERRRLHLRYLGTDSSLPVPWTTAPEAAAHFETLHQQRYSFLMDRPLIVESISIEVIGSPETARAPGSPRDRSSGNPPFQNPGDPGVLAVTSSAENRAQQLISNPISLFHEGTWLTAPIHRYDDLAPHETIDGPAIIAETNGTIVVEPGWRAEALEGDYLRLTRVQARAQQEAVGTHVDPVMLEIFNNLFMSIAEQMGVMLENTAHSVNIKERLDFSCALFDGEGQLVANAPHMPVHLGSMGESVQEVMRRNAGRMKPGDAYAINDPYHGGTHIPDITVVTPVWNDEANAILFFVATRGHHAEIGGITPGSMPPFSKTIDEEGIRFDNWLLVQSGRFRESETLERLERAAHPSRNPAANLADLRAQVAANEEGIHQLRKMMDHFGIDTVRAYMGHVQDNAEECVRRAIANLPDTAGTYGYEMDSGARIEVALHVDRAARSCVIDFTGTAPELATNFNAPKSVTMAAVLYVFRTLVEDDIPLNAGCWRPLDVVIPEGSMLAPNYPAATVAGNVETSQAITGALYAALGLLAEGSGTMNNVSFGNSSHQYYETVASGSGAGPDFDGTAVVQTHMTNSRLTDPEILEWRYPVHLESYSIRRGSGGEGAFRGGDGGIRRLRFLEPMTVSILSSHRRVPPYGMAGGKPGALGQNRIEHADGRVTPMTGCDSKDVEAGDVFVLETPGGGGYGEPS